jgi:topoisomerase-4 subunit A
VDFGGLAVKGRGSKGNLLTRHIVQKVVQKERGGSTLGAIPIWFDETVRRLNEAGHGRYLGRFSGEDKILAILSTGHYQFFPFAMGTHFPDEALTIVKWDPETPITAVYWEGEKQQYNVKRFLPEPARDPVPFITEHPDSKLVLHTLVPETGLHIAFDKRSNDRPDEDLVLAEFISVKGVKAIGNRLTPYKVKELKLTGDVFTVMTPELEEEQGMLITKEEVGHLELPEEEGLERSPMEEFRKSHKVEKADKEDRSPDDPIIGYKPGKQMDLGLD